MAAALVLVVGHARRRSRVLQTGLGKTSLTGSATAATNLAREVTETARSADYPSLTPPGAAAALQSENAAIVSTPRRVDRPARHDHLHDRRSTPAPSTTRPTRSPIDRCAGEQVREQPERTTGDANGDDFRRLTVDVGWTQRPARHPDVHPDDALVNPAGGIGPRITAFPNAANVGPPATSRSFTVTTTPADVIHWNADNGVSEGDAARSSARRPGRSTGR